MTTAYNSNYKSKGLQFTSGEKLSQKERVNLICIPFAGASIYSFRDITKSIADFINVIPVELPGRGKRISERLQSDIYKIVDDIFLRIKLHINTPYAFYGHSLGALLGFLLVKRVLNEKLPQPLHLFCSGRGGPSVENKDKHIYALPKKEFIEKLHEYEGSPKEILNDEGIMEFFEPVLRADFKVVSTYSYKKDTPFDIPITVMFGTNENITYEEAMKWQDETSKKISVRQFSGGHFFIYEHSTEINRIFSQTLQNSQGIISD